MNSTRNIAGLLLLGLAIIMYIIGITTPFMSLSINIKLDEMNIPFIGMFSGQIESKLNKTISYTIFEAIRDLIKKEQVFVAFLLGFFGVFIPILKTLLVIVTLLFYKRRFAHTIKKVSDLIGKFAMADVFVIGIFIAFLYTKFNQAVVADIRDGYKFFVAYVLLSIISNMLIQLPKQLPKDTTGATLE